MIKIHYFMHHAVMAPVPANGRAVLLRFYVCTDQVAINAVVTTVVCMHGTKVHPANSNIQVATTFSCFIRSYE